MKNLDKNSSVNLLKKNGNFRWLSCNGSKFKQKLQSWESNGQMMWITFAGNDFEKKWFRLETKDLGWIEWDEDVLNVIMDICREEFSNEKWGIANTSQMLMGNTMKDNF